MIIKETINKINKYEKKIVILYLLTVIILFSVFAFFYWTSGLTICFLLEILLILFHICWTVIVCRKNYSQIYESTSMYFLFLTIYLFPFMIVFSYLRIYTNFIWYLLIPFGVMFHYSYKEIWKWSVFIFIISIISILASKTEFITNLFTKVEISQNIISLFNILNVTFGALMIVFIFGFFQRKSTVLSHENNEMKEEEDMPSHVNADNQECREAEKEKFPELFNSIVEYFNKDKPYKSKDYNILQLASKFETNIKYISQAINQNTGSNFNTFVNKYRIEAVVEMFDNRAQDKYSLDHIYSKVGFRYQSTFNTAFKKIMGMTPTEYIQSITLQ